MPQRRTLAGLHPRHCKETGTVIMGLAPWQLTKPKPAGILRASRERRKRESQKYQPHKAAGGFAPGGRAQLPDLATGAALATHPWGTGKGAELAAPSCTDRKGHREKRALSSMAKGPQPLGRAVPLQSPCRGHTALQPAKSRDHKKGFSNQCSPAETPAQRVGTVDKSKL